MLGEAYPQVRNPLMRGNEHIAAEEKLKEDDLWPTSKGDQKRLTLTQAYLNRLNSASLARVALQDCQPMARALFGPELENAIETLGRQFHIIRIYVEANADEEVDKDQDFKRQIRETLYEGVPSEDRNTMDATIAAQVVRIEDICLPQLRAAGRKRRDAGPSV
ncbi:hypothetical protein JMM61_16070 [Rhodovulum sulfidophilum]|uniref:hypothetical protein n=1 Tax=Rhodovulum sulfidophilum TaxID=35806 RepID=UPI001926FE7D|nr:hypothetical protein [Rhodovulum sulfidophilum]MBL3586887.1 hypothetical protein [Rhodovulum sulfidophilum]